MSIRQRAAAALLCCLLGIALWPSALAQEVQPPVQPLTQVIVADTALVLNEQVSADSQTLSKRLQEAAGYSIWVVTRHFLGGDAIEPYARALLNNRDDAENTILLLMVIGEERYTLAFGSRAEKAIGRETADTLLSTLFRPKYLGRDYNGAVSALLPQLALKAAQAEGVALDLSGLFGQGLPLPARTPTPEVTPADSKQANPADDPFGPGQDDPAPSTNDDIWTLPQIDLDTQQKYDDIAKRSERGDSGVSIWRILIMVGIFFFLFGRRRSSAIQRRGCGPLGWIFGILGLAKMFGFRK